MARRINVMIDDDSWDLLGNVPAGARSRVVNEALRDWVVRRRRKDATLDLAKLRTRLSPATEAEVTSWVRQDRDRKQ